MFDADVVKTWLRFLGERTVALTSFNAPTDGRQTPHLMRQFPLPAELDVAIAWAKDQNEKSRNVYFNPNEVRSDFSTKKLKTSKADIAAAHFAWADADPACSPSDPGRYAEEHARVQREALEKAEALGATAAISSGNGVQVFLKFQAPRKLEAGTTSDGKSFTRSALVSAYEGRTARFAHAFDANAKVDAVQNIDRLMRLPGTVNWADKTKLDKGYPRKTQSRILFVSDRTWTPTRVTETFPPVEEHAAPRAGAAGRFDEDATPLDEGEQLAVTERLEALRAGDVLLDARWQGRSVGLEDDSRSGLDMSLGAMLKARAFSYREMRYVLTTYEHGAGAEKAKEGDERYFRRIWSRTGSGVTVQEVKERLADLHLEAFPDVPPTASWAGVLFDAHLDPRERAEVLEYIAHTLKVGKKAAVNAAFKEYFAQRSESYKAARSKDRLVVVAKDRAPILYDPLNWNGMLPEVEDALIDAGLMRIDRAYVRVAEDVLPNSDHPDNVHRPENEKLPPPKQILFVPHTRVSMGLAIEKAVCLYRRGEKGTVIPMEVPWDRMPGFMLDLPEKRAPRLTGLVLHPIHTPSGRLISSEGLDPETGLYLALGAWRFPPVGAAPTKDEAVAAAQRIRELLFSEVMFKDPKVDGAAAVAALLTGISRKATSQGPAVLINATVQGTGKTTLARMIHVVLTGRDMPVQTLPEDQGEARKQILATLMRSPAMVTFDNIPDGETVDNPVLSPVITSPTYTQRILGVSQDVDVPTCSLFVLTGNNIGISSDLIRRFVKIDLLAKEACPEQRRFKNADPVAYTQSVRADVVHALLTIQRAWFAAGVKEEGPSLGLGNDVDRLVTWPLAFAGEEGIFAKRDEVAQTSPEEKAKVSALVALAAVFGTTTQGGAVPREKEFTSTDAVRKMGGGSEFPPSDPAEAALRDAIEATDRKRVHGAPALGHFLGTLADQPPREGLVLRVRVLHGRTLYHVEWGGAGGV